MLFFVLIQFRGESPRQRKSRDETVDGGFLYNAVFGINDLQHQPPFRFVQHIDEGLMAFFNLLLLCRKFRWDIEAVVQVFEQFVHVLHLLVATHITTNNPESLLSFENKMYTLERKFEMCIQKQDSYLERCCVLCYTLISYKPYSGGVEL